jgi:hypothetical protein
VFLSKLIERTYYACTRFCRLSELMTYPSSCLAIDVDGLVRGNFSMTIDDDHDFFLYQKPKGGHLAGAILLTERSKEFLNNFSSLLKENIEQNNLYWFLDQVVLDSIVDNFKKGLLPMSYIDWEMDFHSSIWSAKGPRKNNMVFIQEQKIYNYE